MDVKKVISACFLTVLLLRIANKLVNNFYWIIYDQEMKPSLIVWSETNFLALKFIQTPIFKHKKKQLLDSIPIKKNCKIPKIKSTKLDSIPKTQ